MAPAVARTETVVPIVIAPESSGVSISLSVGAAAGVGDVPSVGATSVGGVTEGASIDADIDMDTE